MGIVIVSLVLASCGEKTFDPNHPGQMLSAGDADQTAAPPKDEAPDETKDPASDSSEDVQRPAPITGAYLKINLDTQDAAQGQVTLNAQLNANDSDQLINLSDIASDWQWTVTPAPATAEQPYRIETISEDPNSGVITWSVSGEPAGQELVAFADQLTVRLNIVTKETAQEQSLSQTTKAISSWDIGSPLALQIRSDRIETAWDQVTERGERVLLVRSTQPISFVPVDGIDYDEGSVIGNDTIFHDGRFDGNNESDRDVEPGTAYYYQLWSATSDLTYTRLFTDRVYFAPLNYSALELDGFDFSGGELNSADFENSNLGQADFRSADLSVARFTNANLINANLQGAQISGTDFSNANLTGAQFDNAGGMDTAIFSGATWTDGITICGANSIGSCQP
jgi:uncharacterized protein YjbI with pentapeptide repeats